jgi:hypothetical protein
MIHWDCVKLAAEITAVAVFGFGGIVGLVSGLSYLSETRPKLAVTVLVGLGLLFLFAIEYITCIPR